MWSSAPFLVSAVVAGAAVVHGACVLNTMGLPEDPVACRRVPTPLPSTELQELKSWLEAHEGFTRLTVDDKDGARGLYAACDVKKGEVLIHVPSSLMITAGQGTTTQWGQQLKEKGVQGLPNSINVALILLQEMLDEESFYRPYLRLLPQDMTFLPVFWGPEKRALLAGSSIGSEIDDAIAEQRGYYEAVAGAVPDFAARVTLDTFLHAYALVKSRYFGINLPNGNRLNFLAPFADMANHYRPDSGPYQASYNFHADRGAFAVTAVKDIAAGEQVFLSYGSQTNRDRLCQYGFVSDPVADTSARWLMDSVRVEGLSLAHHDPLRAAKERYLAATGINDGNDGISDGATAAAPPPPQRRTLFGAANLAAEGDEVLSLLRVATAGAEDWGRIIVSAAAERAAEAAAEVAQVVDAATVAPHAISVEGETAALQHLLALVQEHLDGYPTSLASDNQQLDSANGPAPFTEERNALIVLRGEKQLLHEYLEFATAGLKCLRATTAAQLHGAIAAAKSAHARTYCADAVATLKGLALTGKEGPAGSARDEF